MRIVLPPVQPDLLCLIHRTNQQPNPNREQFYVSQRNANVPSNHQAFIQNAIQDVQQVGGSGYARQTFHNLIFLHPDDRNLISSVDSKRKRMLLVASPAVNRSEEHTSELQ